MTNREAIETFENGRWWDMLVPVNTVEERNEENRLHEAIDVAISALQKHEGRSNGCRICFDATIDPDIEGYDLSYHGVGRAEKDNRIMIKSGNGKPMAIMFEKWNGNQWHTVGIYETKFCPECGRPLKGADND